MEEMTKKTKTEESQSKPGTEMVYPQPKELRRRPQVFMVFMYPGFDCGSEGVARISCQNCSVLQHMGVDQYSLKGPPVLTMGTLSNVVEKYQISFSRGHPMSII